METIKVIEPDLSTVDFEIVDQSRHLFNEFENIKLKDVSSQNKAYLALFFRQPFEVEEAIDKIDNQLFLLMQQGIVKPLIIMITEAWDLFNTYAWDENKLNLTPDFGDVPYSKFIAHFTSRAVPEENITWLVMNNIHKKQIKNLRNRGYKIKTRFIQYCYYLQRMKAVASRTALDKRSFTKYYSCLCRGSVYNHRYGMVYNLWANNLLQKGNVSCEPYRELEESKGSNWVNDNETTENFMTNFTDWKTRKYDFASALPLTYDNKVNQHWLFDYDEKYIFDNSFLWIPTESHLGHDGVIISEKTWKAIAYGSPFCINGEKNSLKYLKEMGFKTFEDFWDESYDNDTKPDRIKKITNIVKNLCDKDISEINSMYQDMLPILRHNQKTMIENTQHTDLIKTLKEINDN